MKQRMTIERWYGNSLRLPYANEARRINRFLVSSIGIVSSIVRRRMGKEIRVRFADVPTAHADQSKNLIVINERFISGQFPPSNIMYTLSETLPAILGIVVHEAAHFAYSPATLLPFSEYVEQNTTCIFSKQVALALGNIVEDIFIEAEVDRQVPNLTWMLGYTNDVFFDSFDVQGRIEEAKGIENAPSDSDLIAPVMNAVILAKTRDTIECNPYIEGLFVQALEAKELYRLEDRQRLVLSLYEQIMCNLERLEREDLPELLKVLINAQGVQGENGEVNEEGLTQSVVAQHVDSITAELDGSELQFAITRAEGVNAESPFMIMEKPVQPSPEGTVEMDDRYLALAEVARQHASVNRPYGMQKSRGNSIRNLYRIGTDQKIFAEPVVMNTYKPMQVAILVDCSGSMRSEDVGYTGTRMVRAFSAALGATVALMEARCEVAVYAHTADCWERGDMIVYRIKDFNEPVTEMGHRCYQVMQHEIKGNNRDSFAVEYVGAKLQDVSRKRMLIIYSDGMPIAYGYGGTDALEHGKMVTNNLRQKGVEVLSISIISYAKESNDYMYGEEHNIYNQDTNVIEEVVRRMIGVS